MKKELYSNPACTICKMEQAEMVCGSYDFNAGSLYNGTDNTDIDFFTTE